MSPFFTGQGDTGETGYLGEGRLSKTSLRIEAVGTVDEATAALGVARAFSESETTQVIIVHVQKQLYYLMAELAASPEAAAHFDRISQDDVAWLEEQIADLESKVAMPQDFILPGETPAGGALSLARATIRRAERRTVALLEAGELQKTSLVAYLNRLSSLIFILEIYETSLSGRGPRLARGD